MVKFPTASGVGEVRGDLRLAQECYMASIGMVRSAEALREQIKENPLRGETSSHGKNSRGEREERPPPAVIFLLEGSSDLKTAEPVDNLK